MPNPIPTEPPQPRDPGPTADLYDSVAYTYLDEAALTRYARRLEKQLEARDAEVREWLCDSCNTVYPGPPQPGARCIICPECAGATAPRTTVERLRLEAKNRALATQVVQMRAALQVLRAFNDVGVEFQKLAPELFKEWESTPSDIDHRVIVDYIDKVLTGAAALPAADAEQQVVALVQAAQRFAAFDLDEGDLRLLMISLKATGLSAEDDSYAKRYGEIRDEVRAALAPFGVGK